MKRLILAGMAMCLAACSTVHYPVNAKLAAANEPAAPYSGQGFFRQPGDEELLITLSFSGGGSRAAALAFGVIEELARHEISWKGQRKRLIDEVDIVYGVSGGSIMATYWALKGDAVLDDFPERFLERDFQQQLLDDTFSIGNLWRLGSPRFGRGDLLAESLDRELFHGATFGTLATGRKGPFALISAADLSDGTRFDFLQEYFDLICSDLSRFPLARAVAASSAVPLVFAPITLWNHGQDCPKAFPREVGEAALARSGDKTREQQRLLDLSRYLDVATHPYVHLVDGGVADNLALRGVVEMEGLAKVVRPDVGVPWLRHVRKGLFIVVDAGTESAEHVERSANVPRVGEVTAALADIPIQRYSDETRYLFQQTVARWRQGALDAGVAPQDMPVHLAEVSLQAVPDARRRKKLRGLPTTLYLPQSVTRELREAGAQMLREAPDFQRLLKSLDGTRVMPTAPNAP